MARLTKSSNRWIDGVIGGLGNYFRVNPDIIRIAVLIGVFLLHMQFLIAGYIILMILMPSSKYEEEGAGEHYENSERFERSFPRFSFNQGKSLEILGIILIISGILMVIKYQLPRIWYLFDGFLGSYNHFVDTFRTLFIALILIGGGCWILFSDRKRK